MRSSRDALAMALLALVALGLGVAGFACLTGCGGRNPSVRTATVVAPAAVIAVRTPIPAYPGPDSPSPDAPSSAEPTPYPEPRWPTNTPIPTNTLSSDDLTLIPELTEIASYTATPTLPPPPPPPTATPLPPLDPALETLLYVVQGEHGPELMRVQVDAEGRPVGEPQAFTPPGWRRPRTWISKLVPSPAGRYVAIRIVSSLTMDTALLDTKDWTVEWLMPDPLAEGSWPTPRFLDWAPDGQHALLRGAANGLSVGGELWLLDLSTRQYRVLPATTGSVTNSGGCTDYSPDGNAVVVAVEVDHGQPNTAIGEVWVIPLSAGEPYRIGETLGEHGPVQWAAWSPEGDTIALAIQRDIAFTSADIVRCELWLVPMKPDKGQPRQIANISIDNRAVNYFEPLWEPDGSGIVLVRSDAESDVKSWDEFAGNLYRVDVDTGETVALAAFVDTAVVAPHWAPGGALSFATGDVCGGPLPAWRLRLGPDGRPAGAPEPMEGPIVTGGDRYTAAGVVWLPAGE